MAQLLLLNTLTLSSNAWALCDPLPEPAFMPLIEAAAALMGFVAVWVTSRLTKRVVSHREYLEPMQNNHVRKDVTDVWGCTELHISCCAGSKMEVRRLLERGSDPNAREAWCETPLHMAARAGHVESARLLLSMGADVHATNAGDETPLLLAAHAGHTSLCELLLGFGATVGSASLQDLPPQLGLLLLGDAKRDPHCREHRPLPTLLGCCADREQKLGDAVCCNALPTVTGHQPRLHKAGLDTSCLM